MKERYFLFFVIILFNNSVVLGQQEISKSKRDSMSAMFTKHLKSGEGSGSGYSYQPASAKKKAVLALGMIDHTWSDFYTENDFVDRHWDTSKYSEQKVTIYQSQLRIENIKIGSKLIRKQYFGDGKLSLEAEIVQKLAIDTIVLFDPETYIEIKKPQEVFVDYIDGEFVEYWHNGAIKRKGLLKNTTSIYKKDEKIDNEQIIFSEGKIKYENIREGKITKRKQYFENGKLQIEIEIKQIIKVDTTVSYDEIPVKKVVSTITDELDGNYLQYNPNGTIKMKGEFRNGFKINHWIFNNDDGKPVEDVTYNNKQLKEGKYTSFYTNGKTEKTGTYKVVVEKGKVIDPNTYGEIDGEVSKETERGKWIYYNEDGTIKEEIDYK